MVAEMPAPDPFCVGKVPSHTAWATSSPPPGLSAAKPQEAWAPTPAWVCGTPCWLEPCLEPVATGSLVSMREATWILAAESPSQCDWALAPSGEARLSQTAHRRATRRRLNL